MHNFKIIIFNHTVKQSLFNSTIAYIFTSETNYCKTLKTVKKKKKMKYFPYYDLKILKIIS